MLRTARTMVRIGAKALARALEPRPASDTERPPPPFDSPRGREAEPEYTAAELQEVYFEALDERDTWKRKALEYHALIEGIIGERDRWKDMWFNDSAAHQQAQGILEVAITSGRRVLLRLLRELNGYRSEKGIGPADLSMKPDDPPVGVAAATQALNAQLLKDAPAGIDGVAERDRIAAIGTTTEGPKEPSREQPA